VSEVELMMNEVKVVAACGGHTSSAPCLMSEEKEWMSLVMTFSLSRANKACAHSNR
jgi:hypothetical protein